MAVHMFGAIDVGSYEIGLKIYQISRGKGIKVIDHLERRIDLGSDTYNTGKLSYERVQQVGKILAEYAKIMNTYKVEDYGECQRHPRGCHLELGAAVSGLQVRGIKRLSV